MADRRCLSPTRSSRIQQAIADLGSDVTLVPVWTADFNDPAKTRQLADALIADGVDVIMGSVNLGWWAF